MEQALFMENSTGNRGSFLKNIVTNAREFEQLTETMKEKV
jgi:hypothetical protein